MGCFVCMHCFVVMVIPLYPLLIRLYDDSRDNRMSDRSETTAFDRKVERYDRREDRSMDSRDNRSDRSFGDRRDRDNFSRDSRPERRSTERFERLVTVKDAVRNENSYSVYWERYSSNVPFCTYFQGKGQRQCSRWPERQFSAGPIRQTRR